MGPPEGEAVPMAEGESEPMAEAGPPMDEPSKWKRRPPFDNEFKTPPTTDQPPPEAEKKWRVIRRRIETRAKKVGYN